MNVYDFDKTIYDGDSSIDFYKFNLKRNPKLSKYWGRQAKAALLYKRKKISKTEMKSVFYEFFADIEDMDATILEFWKIHEHKLKDWYLEQKQDDDVIISASPEFFLKPICDQLGVHLIASVVDPKTGQNLRLNCFGIEKVVRFEALFDLNAIDEFYSDSYSDDPLAQYAKRAFFVKGNELLPW